MTKILSTNGPTFRAKFGIEQVRILGQNRYVIEFKPRGLGENFEASPWQFAQPEGRFDLFINNHDFTQKQILEIFEVGAEFWVDLAKLAEVTNVPVAMAAGYFMHQAEIEEICRIMVPVMLERESMSQAVQRLVDAVCSEGEPLVKTLAKILNSLELRHLNEAEQLLRDLFNQVGGNDEHLE